MMFCFAAVLSLEVVAVELRWVGKEKVENHHNDVPFHILERKYSFDAHGEHKYDNGSENMIIHGDNLVALKALLPKYEGRINCIYIDPPYNTGNENWVYNDNVNDPRIKRWLNQVVGKEGEDFTRHDKWLCMMYPRLRLLQKLLSEDGVLVISISYHELHNLVALCREMFATRQIVTVTVQTSGGKPSGGFNYTNEYLVFVAGKDFNPNPSVDGMNAYASPYHGMNLATFNQVQRPNQAYPIFIDSNGVLVGTGKSLQERIDAGDYTGDPEDFVYDYDEHPAGCHAVWPVTKKGVPCVWRLIASRLKSDWEKGLIKIVPQKPGKTKNMYAVQYLSGGIIKKIQSGELKTCRPNPAVPTLEVQDFKTGGVSVPTLWTDKRYYTARGGDQITDILGAKSVFSYPKPLDLIQDVLSRISHPDDIVLDSFAGSGTTGHAVLNLNDGDAGNRRFILVEMCDYAETVTAERIKRVIKGYGEGEKAAEGTGGDFSYYELGPRLLMDDGMLNEDAPEEKIREYIYYSEVRRPLEQAEGTNRKDRYLLGVAYDVAYYFCYEKGCLTKLDRAMLSSLKTKAQSYVIYADKCELSPSELRRRHITFKKIPRDITRF